MDLLISRILCPAAGSTSSYLDRGGIPQVRRSIRCETPHRKAPPAEAGGAIAEPADELLLLRLRLGRLRIRSRRRPLAGAHILEQDAVLQVDLHETLRLRAGCLGR